MTSRPAETIPSQQAEMLQRLEKQINQVFVGKPVMVRQALVTLIAGGHLLIEDVPGVGKTTLALTLAKSIGCSFQRIQFTSDLLPSDVLGVSILNARNNQFEFRPGPLFHQVILADELNRATPRAQGALLEAMNERQVTIENETHELPMPFFVVATQNPHEHHGTFPLPESQLDRFMMRLSIGYPDPAHEQEVLKIGSRLDVMRQVSAVAGAEQIRELQALVLDVHVADAVDEYILAIAQATRIEQRIQIGVSLRGALALRRSAQALALLEGRSHVIPDDIKALAVPVLAHRLIFAADQLGDLRRQAEQFVHSLLERLRVPL